MFADGVRNALSSQKSGGLSTTPVNPQLSPPTPDTTPPAIPENVRPSSPLEQRAEVKFAASIFDQRPTVGPLQSFADSRAESFQTARETPLISTRASRSQVLLPDEDRLPEHWLDNTRDLPDFDAEDGRVVDLTDYAPSGMAEENTSRTSPHPPRQQYRFQSPQVEREEPDWEKHISYVSGPDELDYPAATETFPRLQEDNMESLNGLGVSGVDLDRKQHSVENINNSVYKHIQEENMRRESAISNGSSAIRAGIVIPSAESTPKSVRRRAKCGSLRDGPGDEGKRRGSDNTEHTLKHEKRHLPPRDHLQESPILVAKTRRDVSLPLATRDHRQVSSPARLGPDASRMTMMTANSQLAAARTRNATVSQEHKLKRQTHADRLSKNMTVRRSSLEISPSDLEEAFKRIDQGAASVRRQKFSTQQRPVTEPSQPRQARTQTADRQSQMNQGVKRSKPQDIKKPIEIRLRKVIPSVTSEPESTSSSPRQVRRFSRDERLENNDQLRRSSVGHAADASTHTTSEFGARRTSHDPSLLSSPRKSMSMDARFLHPTTTPMSTSAFSDRTADIEVGEASGVRIYPHNNESLLVVQQGSRPTSKDKKTPDGPSLANVNHRPEPTFAANVDPPTPILGMSKPGAHVDSPLTNPRAAPEPPILNFIPPTPNQELERELGDDDEGVVTMTARPPLPARNLSFKQKVRRYSDSFFGRSTSYRRPKPREPPPRDNFLSPMWRPKRLWDDEDEYDSEDDYYDDQVDYESNILPPGGDTSNVGDEKDQARQKRGVFPRTMSKRLPGFTGGFLQGNSLGIDRHGTNSRRHYVSTTSKRSNSDSLNSRPGMPLRQYSNDSVRSNRSKSFKVPFTGGMRAKWVGTQAFRAKVREVRLAKEEREREKRREALKGRIGMRVYHG